jgi:glycosyltransferase involved in cell wall biosynthesis
MNVLHISPTWFGDGSVVGGGERYSIELARACAALTPTTFVSFDDRPSIRHDGRLRVRLLRKLPFPHPPMAGNPLHPGLYAEIRRAGVIHCHQADTFVTNAAIVAGAMLGKRVFVTDLGAGHPYAPSLKLPVLSRATGLLLLSEYSRTLWNEAPAWRRPARIDVIHGGVDSQRFHPGSEPVTTEALFVGRIVRHKGIEHAIAAVEPPMRLVVAGRPYDPAYAAMLREAAGARDVTFREDVSDDELPALYARSLATIVPSVYRLWGGGETMVPELLGLVALESMACGTPPIVSRVASLPELVEDGVTGFVVPPNDPRAIAAALAALASDPARRADMGRRARRAVQARFTWSATAERCLRAYTL